MAQIGGILIDQQTGFEGRVVLAKVSSSEFYFEAVPGDSLMLRAEIKTLQEYGAMVAGTVHCGDRLQANIDLMFATLTDDRFTKIQLFEPAEFCRMIRLLKVFDVGVNTDGTPIEIPQHMLEAERAQMLTPVH
jgi:3-hydroxyacyl-[acyl-carrier-protein] dehydratase